MGNKSERGRKREPPQRFIEITKMTVVILLHAENKLSRHTAEHTHRNKTLNCHF